MTLRFGKLHKSTLGRCVRSSREPGAVWKGTALTFESQNGTWGHVMWLFRHKLVYINYGRAIANDAGRRTWAKMTGEPLAKIGLGPCL